MRNNCSPFIVALLLLLLPKPKQQQQRDSVKMADFTETEKIYGVKLERNPPQSKLAELGVTSWPKWACNPSKFPWEFSTGTETMYLLKGKVKVYCDGFEESFEIRAGDLVVFPKGMKVVWDVIEAVDKHYHLDS